jgi:hypothetical protein
MVERTGKEIGWMSQTFADHIALVQDAQHVPGLDAWPALVLDRELSAEVLWQVYVLPLD